MNSKFTKYLLSATLLFIGILFSQISFAQTIIKGKIKDKKGVEVPYASIVLKIAKDGEMSSETGDYQITTKSTGKDTLVVSSIGYDDFILPITLENKEITLNVTLKEPVENLDEVVISAGTIEANNERAVAVLKPLDIVTTAGGQGDIIGALQTLPGVQRNGGDQTGLMVRGGDVNESSMIIDGTIAQNAMEYLEKANGLFSTQDTSSVLKPYWGKIRNDVFIGKCNE